MPASALSPAAVASLVRRIKRAVEAAGRPIRMMEVCGTHTTAIFRTGLRSILPEGVELVSGPGCPVCVTPPGYIDRAVAISRLPGTAIATYGDMLRVPGTSGSLERERALGVDVRVVYSALDALGLARSLPDRRVVFLAVGFETTTPGIAATALAAERDAVGGFSLLAAPKLIPPALEAVLAAGARLDAFICPGHVSVVIGSNAYEPVARDRRVPCVVAGFEAPDILLAVAMAAEQVAGGRAVVEIAYRSAVAPEGNHRAREVMNEVFEPVDAEWRGLGTIPASGLALRERFAAMDAAKIFDVTVPEPREPVGCRCGEVLAGLAQPEDCGLFADACTPGTPVGPCMVSSEGTCAAHYKYGLAGRVR